MSIFFIFYLLITISFGILLFYDIIIEIII